MPPRKAPAQRAPPAAPARSHEPVSGLQFYAGAGIVFLSAGFSYLLAQSPDDALLVSGRMWMMNAFICLLASWATNDHSWRVTRADI